MAENKCVFPLQVVLIIYLIGSNLGQIDPYASRSRIVVKKGNLELHGGTDGNISLVSKGKGSILLNGVDMKQMVVTTQSGGYRASANMADLTDQGNRLNELAEKVNRFETNITAVANKVDRLIGQGRIANLRRIMSKVQKLEKKVKTLTQLLTTDECVNNPCRNGGSCVDSYNGYICNCPSNWEGQNCDIDVNECARFAGTSFGCQNGATCTNTPGGYSCNCPANWRGVHCSEMHDDCSSASHQELCGHGTCIDEKRAIAGQAKYRCICDAGWSKSGSSPACTEDIDECSGPDRRCSQNPLVVCINLPGSFHCGHCPAGYTGNGVVCTDINECELQNGGCSQQPFVQCTNTIGSRTCGPCPSGYVGNGAQCSFVGVCSINRGGCHPLATCIENSAITGTFRECRCPSGYVGSGEGLTGCAQGEVMSCANNPCQHGTCQMHGQTIYCVCDAGYNGALCERMNIDPCHGAPCTNGGTCIPQGSTFYCNCPIQYDGPTCAVRKNSCGGSLSGPNGTLQFPDNGVYYDHLMNCGWVISVAPNKVIRVTFDRFNLENGAHCEFDFLQLNDGPHAGSRVLGRFCSEDLHGRAFNTTHSALYLWFKSDRTVASTGFALAWEAVDPVCGGVFNSTDYGSVNSPGYPGPYPANRTCSWLVQVPFGKRIQFQFATLRLEHHQNCSYDYLKIYDGATERDPMIGTYCTSVSPAPLVTSGHTAMLIFHSDGNVQDTGFHITYSSQSSVQGCGGILTQPTGQLSSPNYPDVYESNLNCEWLIRIHPQNRILFSFKEFALESHSQCAFDYIEIFEGASDADPLLARYCGSTLPGDLLSNSNQLFIRFRTDNSLAQSGFKAQYKTICGGVFTEPSGVLSSPYYPENYPARAQCIYDIRLPSGILINVTFHNMAIEDHSDCRFDYLQIRDGDGESSPLMHQLCGTRTPENVVSSYNVLWMKFQTDGSVQNQGFYAEYNTIEVGCGGVLSESSGEFNSPRHPDLYPHNSTCAWYLKAPPGFIIRLTFTTFALEPDTACKYDAVEVRENPGNLLGRFCGTKTPPVLTSMDNTMFVKFVTDSSVARDGFTAKYEFLNGSEACSGTFYQESGVIRSPGFPIQYPHNTHCVWILKTGDNQQISLNISSFQLEQQSKCRYDFLEIRNGGYELSPLIGRYCGTQFVSVIRSHSNTLRLEFKTDGSMSAPGFEIYFDSTATGCGGVLRSPRGSIVSPNYPQPYAVNADCAWRIQVSAGSLITLAIIDVDIEEHQNCQYDYVEIFDGSSEDSKSLLRMCNNQQSPGTVTSTGNALWVRFRTDATQVAGGFHFSYQTLCNNKLTRHRGVIESPNFPNTYPHNHNCTWTIEVPKGNNISLVFSHFFLEGGESCDADYVEILEMSKNGSQHQIGKFCGNMTNPPPPIETSTNIALVRLVTDRTIAREGFRLEYVMKGCGGDISDKLNGVLTSPNYPNGYPFATTCIWHISVDEGSAIELNVLDFHLEGSWDCTYDYLRVYGGDETSPLLLNTCNEIHGNQTVTSHGNMMTVVFNSDISVTGKGFKATFNKTSSGCGGRFTASESQLMSPGFPANYDANVYCDYSIEVDPTHRVKLDFYDFQLPNSTNCTMGFVEIYGSQSSEHKICGAKPEGSFFSTSNKMLLRLVADGEHVDKGFRAHYSTVCGGRLLADSGGVITSPNYPMSHTILNCNWTIYTSDPGERISLIVTNLIFINSSNCSLSSLQVSGVSGTNFFCGRRAPPQLLSSGAEITIILKDTGIFRATYGLASTHCGGSYTSIQGTFGTPGYPYNYDRDLECVWTIVASAGSTVHLNFEAFDIEESENCNQDYVEIHKEGPSGPLIGRYCGNRIPTNVTSSRKLWIKFRSDDIETGRGFLAQYELLHSGVLNGTSGEIASPGYPIRYNEKGNYEWTVYAPFGMFISFHFLEMNIFILSRSDACATQVEIYDGPDDQSPFLGQFCGYQLPDPVTTTGSVAFVRFRSSAYYFGVFRLAWNAVTESGIQIQEPTSDAGDVCFEELQLNTSESVVVSSPNYPNNYPNKINCTTILRAPHLQHIELTIDDMQLETNADCTFDTLDVYYLDNPNVEDWYLNSSNCKKLKSSETIVLTSPTNLMKLQFKTDGYMSHRGFHATASAKCGVHLRGTHGVIKSDALHEKMNRLSTFTCEFRITVRTRRTIRITFERFHVPPATICSDNYLLLLNGASASSPFLGSGKYCGSNVPIIPETSSNEAYFQVVVKSIVDGAPDFELRYSEVSLSCGGRLYISEEIGFAEFTSPGYPSPPEHATECEWVIVSPPGTRMRIDFEREFHLSTNCYSGDSMEYLELFDGGTELAPPLHRFCGHDQPSSVQSTGNAFFVRYVTTSQPQEAGFKARVTIAQCGGTLHTMGASLHSPNYPRPYLSSVECEWRIRIRRGFRARLRLVTLATPEPRPGRDCLDTDYLEIRDDQDNLFGRYCGTKNESLVLEMPGSEAYIKFKSNSAVTGKGFLMLVEGDSNEGCGGIIEGSSGAISSPNYPNGVQAKRHCYYHITAPEGRRVKLTFLEFNLPRDETTGNCLSYLQVNHPGFWRRDISIHNHLCGSELPPPIDSSSRRLIVVLITNGLSPGQGFVAHYTTEEEALCGGVLPWPSGTISTSPFVVVNNMEIDCNWLISRPQSDNNTSEQTLVMSFDHVDVPGSPANYCNNGSMFVFAGRVYLGRYCGNYSSVLTVTSPFPVTSLRLVIGVVSPSMGVHGRYYVNNCGGELSGSNQDITSPGYPERSPPNMDCHWVITVPKGETITLHVLDASMDGNCKYCDNVIVYSGYRNSDPVLLRMRKLDDAQSGIWLPVTSYGHVMSIVFHCDDYGQGSKFRFSTTEVQRGCGGIISTLHHVKSRNISSPGYPSSYDNNVECVWTIDFVPGYLIRLDFDGRFDIEMDTACRKDYLLVEDRESSGSWSERARLCGPSTPSSILSKSNKMRITFHSNERIKADGFNVNFTIVCGGNFTQPEGTIVSPNYPDMYDNLLNCSYVIGKEGQYISLSFDDYFSIESHDQCKYDYIQIYQGEEKYQEGPYCGMEVPVPRNLRGPVLLNFVTDISFVTYGFRARYTIIDCGLNLTAPSGVIDTLHSVPAPLLDFDCTWTIFAPQGKVVRLKFTTFNFDANFGCWDRFVEIRDGPTSTSPLIGRMCGNTSNPIVKSTGNVLTLRQYLKNFKDERQGFVASYISTYGEESGCGGTLNTTSGIIQSLDVDSDGFYEPDLDCIWFVKGRTDDFVFQVTFERLDIEPASNGSCVYDFVELLDDTVLGSVMLGRYCGNTSPGVITTSSQFSVIFHSDGQTNKAGFKLHFQAVSSPCGPSALVSDATLQNVTSPNYPLPYPVNLHCYWTFHSIPSSNRLNSRGTTYVQLTVNAMDVPCDGDYLHVQKIRLGTKLRYGKKEANNEPLRICGQNYPHEFIFTQGTFRGLLLMFHSNAIENRATGFSLSYTNIGCNMTYNKRNSAIANPGYPESYYAQREKCEVKIAIEAERTLALYFDTLELYDISTDCINTYLKVYGGANSSGTLLGKYCGNFIEADPIFWNGPELFLEINLHNVGGRYRLIYTSSRKDPGCGGSISTDKGVLTSPLYPRTYNKDAECTWTIRVPGYHSVRAQFEIFVLNSTSGCESNYLELSDGPTTVRYCGSDLPGVHNTMTNELRVKLVTNTFNDGPGFLMRFSSNPFLPDSSLPLIQKNNEEDDSHQYYQKTIIFD